MRALAATCTALTKRLRQALATGVSCAAASALALSIAVGPAHPCWAAEAAPRAAGTQAADLHRAALSGDVAAVVQALHAGADPNAKDAYGSTPLIVAATFGRTEVARALIDAGADLGATNPDGSTALHVAAYFCRREIVQALLQHGADRRARNHAGHTALDTVAAPFEDMKAGYDRIRQALAPLGLKLEDRALRELRPGIAALLRPRADELATVGYAPAPRGDLALSTPSEQDLDPRLVAELFLEAADLQTLYGLLVLKNDHLVAEGYFNQGSIDQLSGRQSVTKSFVSALVGIALAEGCLTSVDQTMLGFFPELAPRVEDPRKRRITVRELLQMRAGYPWEGRTPPYFERLFLRNDWHWLPHIVDFPLVEDPGAAFAYSNLGSHILAVITARACGTDLRSFAQDKLLSPIGAEVPQWTRDPDGYRWGWGEIQLSARDMAKFGLLYLHEGRAADRRVVPADWVKQSLQRYSQDILVSDGAASAAGLYLRDIGYGYQWWSARAGTHRVDFAWGHGGQLIVLLADLDMVVVTTADPLYQLPEAQGWRYESRILDLVGRFVNSLPDPERPR